MNLIFEDDMWNVVRHSKNYNPAHEYLSTNYLVTDKSKNI